MRKIILLALVFVISALMTGTSFPLEQWADGPIWEKLSLRKDVKDAFERRAKREKQIDQLLKQGAAGESNLGFVQTMFMSIPENERALMEEENRDRLLIMTAVAQILVENEGLALTEENLQAKYPTAVRFFGGLREKYVMKGTMIQSPDGKWSQKY
jgi:hypothetical protein